MENVHYINLPIRDAGATKCEPMENRTVCYILLPAFKWWISIL